MSDVLKQGVDHQAGMFAILEEAKKLASDGGRREDKMQEITSALKESYEGEEGEEQVFVAF
ncbi:hypothetical protein TWF506_001895 [Arthrobotrys conoides]|uniref:Uncharacterized protein n=1 Tax=Arthrobotrys conoides TaxID=74498 RepID=A0AAN8S266_9PEZI